MRRLFSFLFASVVILGMAGCDSNEPRAVLPKEPVPVPKGGLRSVDPAPASAAKTNAMPQSATKPLPTQP